MSRSQTAIEGIRLAEGENAAGRDDFVSADNDGTVMERRRRCKDRPDQFGGKMGVKHRARLDVTAQPSVALEDEDRANSAPAQTEDSVFDLAEVGGALEFEDAPKRFAVPDHRKAAAKFGLKDDEKRHYPNGLEGSEKPGERRETEQVCDRRKQKDGHEPKKHLGSAGSADEKKKMIDEERDDDDVDCVQGPSDIWKSQLFPRSFVGSTSTGSVGAEPRKSA